MRRGLCVRAALALGGDSKQPKRRVRTDRAALQNAAPVSSATNTTLGDRRPTTKLLHFGLNMEFECDQTKAAANVSKHGVSFDEAKTVFDDPLYVDFYNPDHSLNEHR